jgi:hypothetical protein
MVGFAMDIQWCIIGFGIGHVFSIGQVKSYMEKVDAFLAGFDGDF